MVLTHAIQTIITPEKKIGEGSYREVYMVRNKAVKVLKHFIVKDYILFSIKYPTHYYTKLKFGIDDFNEHEFGNYSELKIPDEFKDNFAQIFGIEKNNGNSFSLCELILDSDGNVSKSVKEHKNIKDIDFWKNLDKLEEFLIDNRIYLMDIRPENILAKEINGSFIPVIIDYKRVGPQTYPFQFLLKSTNGIENKIRRRFERLKELNK